MKCRGSERFWEFWLAQSCISSCTRFFWLRLLAQVREERIGKKAPFLFYFILFLCCVLAIISWLISIAAVVSQNSREQWLVPDDAALEEYFDDLREDKAWPTGPVEYVAPVAEDQNMLTTPKAKAAEEGGRCSGAFNTAAVTQDCSVLWLDPDPKESSAWKMALLGTIMFVSLLGSLSLAYYMCVWRGGRIHYSLQKDVSV